MTQDRSKLALLYDDAVFTVAPYFTKLGYYLLGCITGAGGMMALPLLDVGVPKAKPQPVVVERQVAGERVDLEAQIKVLNAKVEANYTQQMQRQKEVRFKTEKLELAKQVHDTQLVTAQEGADHIRQMARELGITKMVMK